MTYYEDGICAQCGRKAVEYGSRFSYGSKLQPALFCSDECLERAVLPYLEDKKYREVEWERSEDYERNLDCIETAIKSTWFFKEKKALEELERWRNSWELSRNSAIGKAWRPFRDDWYSKKQEIYDRKWHDFDRQEENEQRQRVARQKAEETFARIHAEIDPLIEQDKREKRQKAEDLYKKLKGK